MILNLSEHQFLTWHWDSLMRPVPVRVGRMLMLHATPEPGAEHMRCELL